MVYMLNLLSPHDASKHHLASLEKIPNFLQLVVLVRQFLRKCLKNNTIFFHLSPTVSHLHSLQVENCDSSSRLVVDEDDNGKLRLERVYFVVNPFIYLATIKQFRDYVVRLVEPRCHTAS